MKRSLWRAGTCAAIVTSLFAQATLGQANPEAIKQALAKTPKVVNASWWGFDEIESTKALQSAINSGAGKVVVENMGKPWIVDKVQLASNQEVLFEKGVVVLAKKGAFKGKGDCLFTASVKQNVTLTGYGATFKMWKADYHTDAYAKAEWRHCLSIRSCANVKVYGLTLAQSGGDGVYLGVSKAGVTNTNVHIKDVVCDGNNRQGISVISAENLLIEDTVLKNTWGTAPQAGIDFEPNRPGEKIVNCVMRNCIAENNRGAAYVLYLKPLNGTSADVSVRIENCVSRGTNSISAAVVTANGGPKGTVKGLIEFVNCKFEDTRNAGVSIRDVPVAGCQVRFVDCTIADPAKDPAKPSPIMFAARHGCTENVGGVEFADCTINERVDRPLMAFRDYAGGLKVLDVTGALALVKGGERRVIPITEKLLDELMPSRTLKQIKRFDLSGMRFAPVFPDAAPQPTKRLVRLRKHAQYLVYAEQGDEVRLRVRHLQVGRYAGRAMPVRIHTPSGKPVKGFDAAFKQETSASFTAAETGAFKITCEPAQNCVHVDSPTHRLCVISPRAPIQFIATRGDFYFWAPAGVKEFGVKVLGAGGERVNAAVFDPSGKKVWEKDSIDVPQMFVKERQDASKDEVWRLHLDRPSSGFFEDNSVDLLGVPPVLSYSRDALLKPE